jgi:hypothetical protein
MSEQVQTSNKQVQTGLTIVTPAGVGVPAGEATDAVTRASETSGKSDGAVPGKGGAHGVNFCKLSVSFSASGLTAATATDAMTGASGF